MRKILAVATAIALFPLSACGHTPQRQGRVEIPAGYGTVTEVEYKAAKRYSKSECTRKFGKARCVVPPIKTAAWWEVEYMDASTGDEVDVRVTDQAIADQCAKGDIFNGTSCN